VSDYCRPSSQNCLIRAGLEALLKANAAPRCGARSKRTGKPCRGAAMPNGRCKFHGGKSTGPRTMEGLERSRRANWKHVIFEKLLDDLLTSPCGLHHGMRQVAELLLRQPAANRRMSGAYEADETVPKQPLLEKVDAIDVGKIPDRPRRAAMPPRVPAAALKPSTRRRMVLRTSAEQGLRARRLQGLGAQSIRA
jgi:hypothetical protein